MYRSQWAASSAIDDYGADPAKVFVTSLGPCINQELIPAQIDAADKSADGTCRLLLVGLEWRRKECDTALEATRMLRGKGIDARPTLCGCRMPTSSAYLQPRGSDAHQSALPS